MYALPIASVIAMILCLGIDGLHGAFSSSAAVSHRLNLAAAVLNKFVDPSEHLIPKAQMKMADCVAMIPGFKKTSTGADQAVGQGFITCRQGEQWSSPAAITLQDSNPALRGAHGKTDIVMLSMDCDERPKVLSGRFAIGRDASAAWGNAISSASARDPKTLFFGRTNGTLVDFDLDGRVLSSGEPANKALNCKSVANSEIIAGNIAAPSAATAFAGTLGSAFK